MLNWSEPKTSKALRGFFGLIGSYIKFFEGYESINQQLTKLLGKDQFKWFEVAVGAFTKPKLAMLSTPVLVMVDYSKQFVLRQMPLELALA